MIKVYVHDNRNKLESKSEYGQIEELKIEIRKPMHKVTDWRLFSIISFKESVGRKPPEEMTVIAKLKLSSLELALLATTSSG